MDPAMNDPIVTLGAYRGYELTAVVDRSGVCTGFARLIGEDLLGTSPVDGLAFSVSRLSIDAVRSRLHELVDEELGPHPDLDDTDVDLAAKLQHARPSDLR